MNLEQVAKYIRKFLAKRLNYFRFKVSLQIGWNRGNDEILVGPEGIKSLMNYDLPVETSRRFLQVTLKVVVGGDHPWEVEPGEIQPFGQLYASEAF